MKKREIGNEKWRNWKLGFPGATENWRSHGGEDTLDEPLRPEPLAAGAEPDESWCKRESINSAAF